MDEIVDVVDRNDAKIGVATRKLVHETGAWHRGIHILVFDSQERILIQRRSAKKDKSPGYLDLSVSEHAVAGETFEETARRGLREELGIEGVPLTPVLKFRMAYGPADNMISVLFHSRFSGETRSDPSEVEEMVPFEIEELRSVVAGPGERLTSWTREILRWYFGLPSKVEEFS